MSTFFFSNQFRRHSKKNFSLMICQGAFNSTPVLSPIKFCNTCHIFRSPRIIHCNFCDCCIRGFDHHCIWLGTCIGDRNYGAFLTYVTLLNISIPLCTVQTIRAIFHLAESSVIQIIVSSLLGLHALCLIVVSKTLSLSLILSVSSCY